MSGLDRMTDDSLEALADELHDVHRLCSRVAERWATDKVDRHDLRQAAANLIHWETILRRNPPAGAGGAETGGCHG